MGVKSLPRICRELIDHGEVSPVVEDAAFIEIAAARLPPEPWNAATWSAWTAALKRSRRCCR